jgi:hypothetical protein
MCYIARGKITGKNKNRQYRKHGIFIYTIILTSKVVVIFLSAKKTAKILRKEDKN